MTSVRLSPRAQADLIEIWRYTETRWGADLAESYIQDIRQVIERAAVNPTQGRACDEIRAGYRRLTARSHLVFYRPVPASIEVIRILHQRMDIDRQL